MSSDIPTWAIAVYLLAGAALGVLTVKVGPGKDEIVSPTRAWVTIVGCAIVWPSLVVCLIFKAATDWLLDPSHR